jgi:hypothetical protein
MRARDLRDARGSDGAAAGKIESLHKEARKGLVGGKDQINLEPAATCIGALLETPRDDEEQETRRIVGVKILTEAIGALIRGR